MFKILIIAFLICGTILEGRENFILKKKYNLSICAIIHNESKYLKEWIEFHRLVGVDHFYLYNNNSTDRLHKTLSPYLKKGVVTLIYWPDNLGPEKEKKPYLWAWSTEIPAYENAVIWSAVKETKWLALLTTDQYLVPVESNSLKELLKKYDTSPGIVPVTDTFDASGNAIALPKKLIIESIDMAKPTKQNLDTIIEPLILKPEQYNGFSWPPYKIRFKNDISPTVLKRSELRVNRYINRDQPIIENLKHKAQVDIRQLSQDERSSLLDKGYILEDQERPIYRYLPDLKAKCLGGGVP